MRFHKIRKIRHAGIMVLKNYRAYGLLSVTILISFTILLSFLAFVDSDIYNDNKEIFSISPNIVFLYGVDENTPDKYQVLMEQMKEYDNTCYFQYFEQQVTLANLGINVSVNYIPNNIWGFYTRVDEYFEKVTMLKDRDFSLKKNEAIVDKRLYDILKNKNQDGTMEINLPVYNENQEPEYYIKCQVIGYCQTGNHLEQDISYHEDLFSEVFQIYVSQDSIRDNAYAVNQNMLIYSESPAYIIQSAVSLGLGCDSPYIYQREASERIITQLKNKYILFIAFIFILGINLYGCMKNVLSGRYFEIGVKRAIGAKKQDIVLQFFVEGTFVMLLNIALSILFTDILLLVYKVYMLKANHVCWTIFISSYSVAAYVISCILLTIVVGVVLASQAVNFEIVKYLKEQ